MPHKALKALPTFKTEAEKRTFWKTHDAADYFDLSKAQLATFANLKLSTRKDFEQYLSAVPDAPANVGDERT